MKMPNNDNEIEKKYSELKKKYALPEFREMDIEFEISDIEETKFLLTALIRRIAERLDFYTTMLEELLQPDTSNLYAMHEIRFFGENEKKQMYELYTKLMGFNRQSIEVSLEHDERMQAEFISSMLTEWQSLKGELLMFIKKMRASWKTEEADIKEDLGYLG